jgi:hypothetical protein
MKIQPELEAIPMPNDPRNPDSQEALPALQLYQAGCAAADRRHDHILRTALLTAGCATLEPNKH